MKKIIDGLFGDRASPQNLSALARAVGVSDTRGIRKN